jgi:hypothetical protein
VGNQGTVDSVGADSNYKMNILLGALGTNLADFAIYTGSPDQGWITGYYQTKVSYSFITLGGPLGFPVGTPGTTMGLLFYNDANWKSAIKLPNNVWIHSAYSVGGGDMPVIKANADDATISLGALRVAASVAANFSATHYIYIKDQNGLDLYIPAKTAIW